MRELVAKRIAYKTQAFDIHCVRDSTRMASRPVHCTCGAAMSYCSKGPRSNQDGVAQSSRRRMRCSQYPRSERCASGEAPVHRSAVV
eukprot:3912110-Amphidinium_carterae.1